MPDPDEDSRVRTAAFEWLRRAVDAHGEVLLRSLLERGFELDGVRVPIVGPQGIFKPRLIPEIPLSITTVPSGPYSDSFGPDDLLQYRYRGTDPFHRENVGLRKAMSTETPLVYCHGIVPGKYLTAWPVYIVGDSPSELTFTAAIDDYRLFTHQLGKQPHLAVSEPYAEVRRAYVTASVRRRLHQDIFRARVLRAYREQCAFCRLRHEELLDAAHIIPDSDPEGEPLVTNGIALCKLHHAAYDRHFVGIRSDYRVVVRQKVLDEEDGPMLRHGLQGLHGGRLIVPRSPGLRPDPERLAKRFTLFESAGGGS